MVKVGAMLPKDDFYSVGPLYSSFLPGTYLLWYKTSTTKHRDRRKCTVIILQGSCIVYAIW